MCTPTIEILKEISSPAKIENIKEIRTPKMKPFLGEMIAQEQILAPEMPMAPKFKIELCFMASMTSRSRPPVHPSMNIKIVNCQIGETCTPSNSEILGNDFG